MASSTLAASQLLASESGLVGSLTFVVVRGLRNPEWAFVSPTRVLGHSATRANRTRLFLELDPSPQVLLDGLCETGNSAGLLAELAAWARLGVHTPVLAVFLGFLDGRARFRVLADRPRGLLCGTHGHTEELTGSPLGNLMESGHILGTKTILAARRAVLTHLADNGFDVASTNLSDGVAQAAVSILTGYSVDMASPWPQQLTTTLPWAAEGVPQPDLQGSGPLIATIGSLLAPLADVPNFSNAVVHAADPLMKDLVRELKDSGAPDSIFRKLGGLPMFDFSTPARPALA